MCGRIVEKMRRNALMLLTLLPAMVSLRAQQPTAEQAEAERPLPAMRDLLLDVERNQRAAEAMRRDYTYHVRDEEQDYDSKGNVKKTTVTESESLTIDGVRVDREVARDGKPLTPDEAKKESEKIDKEVATDKEQGRRDGHARRRGTYRLTHPGTWHL